MKHLFKSFVFAVVALMVLGGSPLIHAQSQAVAEKAAAEVHQTININTASAEMLSTGIKGVGMKKAEAIVAYREANGPFKNKEDLLQVKGIGAKTLEKNWDRIVLE